VQGRRRGGGDGPPIDAEQRGGGGGGDGDGAGGRVHGPGSRGAAGHEALRRGALVREARLPTRAAARGGGRECRSEAARLLHVRTAVGDEFEVGGRVRICLMPCGPELPGKIVGNAVGSVQKIIIYFVFEL
jgi:hypothetical protein